METSAPQVMAPGRSPLLLPCLLYFLSSSPPESTHSHVHAHTHTRVHTRCFPCSLRRPAPCPSLQGPGSAFVPGCCEAGSVPTWYPWGSGGACCAFPEGLGFKLSLKQGWEGWETGWGLRQVRATLCSAPKILCDLSSFSREQ